MQRALSIAAFVSLLILLTACAGLRPSDAQPFHWSTEARPGYATLYIYRPYFRNGSAIWPEVFFNGSHVVGLKSDAYTVIFIRPGKYSIRTEMKGGLTFVDNEPGEFEIDDTSTYFLVYDVRTREPKRIGGFYAGRDADAKIWFLVPFERASAELSRTYFVPPYVDRVEP